MMARARVRAMAKRAELIDYTVGIMFFGILCSVIIFGFAMDDASVAINNKAYANFSPSDNITSGGTSITQTSSWFSNLTFVFKDFPLWVQSIFGLLSLLTTVLIVLWIIKVIHG